jgi:hypothetical protein
MNHVAPSSRSDNSDSRHRRIRPEVAMITIQRIENLTLSITKTDGVPSLVVNTLEERVAHLEDAPVPAMQLHDHAARLGKVEAVLFNGHVKSAA